MAFQFQCPQGHFLETDESYAGQPCQCPYCGMTFAIPAPPGYGAPSPPGGYAPPSAAATSSPGLYAPGPQTPAYSPPGAVPAPFGASQPEPGLPAGPSSQPAIPAPFSPETKEPECLHIACPNGHELETPREMLGQDVLCPHCNVQFRLREKDSVEYKRRKAQEIERRDRKAGQMWLNWAIVAAVLVVIGIVGLIVLSSTS